VISEQTRNHAHADLPRAQKRVLARGEPQITGEHELASGAVGPPSDRSDADHRRTSQTDKNVDPGGQPSGTDPKRYSLTGVILQVLMGQVEISAPSPKPPCLADPGNNPGELIGSFLFCPTPPGPSYRYGKMLEVRFSSLSALP
jgi:hypothetical protein